MPSIIAVMLAVEFGSIVSSRCTQWKIVLVVVVGRSHSYSSDCSAMAVVVAVAEIESVVRVVSGTT